MSARYSALRTALRAAGIMLVFTLVFTAMMASTYRFTRPAIEASMQEAQMRLIDEVPRVGAGGCKVAFVHPKSASGVLLELKDRER